MLRPKLIVVGYGRHGKDTFCEMLKPYGFTFETSSRFCSKKFIYDKLKNNYNSEEECFKDRHNHRELWFKLITEYCTPDKSQLGRDLFAAYDIYCGARNKEEFNSLKDQGMFYKSIWVDRSKILPPEDKSSMTIDKSMCDIIIDNNGSLEDLEKEVQDFMSNRLFPVLTRSSEAL